MPETEGSPKTYKTLQGFNTSGRDYGSGEPFPADGHDVPIQDVMVLQSRGMIAEASWSQKSKAVPDDSLRQENEALRKENEALKQALFQAQNAAIDLTAESEGEAAPRRRGRPPKVRTEETGDAEE